MPSVASGSDEPRIVFVNDAFELHTGYARADVLEQSPRMLFDLEAVGARLHDLARGLRDTRKARTELLVRRKSGTQFWVELEVVSVQAAADEVAARLDAHEDPILEHDDEEDGALVEAEQQELAMPGDG